MNEMNGYDVEDLQVGMQATFSKTIGCRRHDLQPPALRTR